MLIPLHLHSPMPNYSLRLPVFAAMISAAPAAVDFSHEIVPILKKHCTECHTGDKKKGGLSFNTRADLMKGSENGKVVIEGKGDESLMVKLMHSTDPDEQMPPKGDRVSAADIAKLKAWIDEGASWTEGFAFKKPAYEPPLKPRRPTLPAAAAGRTNPVDRILDADLAKNKVPSPRALSDGAFYRRLHLDLVGLLPTPDSLATFLADKSPDKRNKAINELLGNSTAYAEHWLTFWNDLLRNDYAGTGYIDGGRKQISSWLYKALVDNKPYDQFVRELVAPTPDSEGFGRGIKWRGEVSAGQTVPIQFAQSMGQAFLGINLKCASCHDSFIDRWKLDEAYGLAAVFSPSEIEIHRCDVPSGRKAKAAWLFPELGQIDASKPPQERLKQMAALMTHPENGRLTRTIVNRLWHRLMGHGIVHPVDAMQTEPWNSDLLDYLASDLADQKYDLKKTLALICQSQAYQSEAEVLKDGEEKKYVYAGPRAKRLTAEQFTDALWQITDTAPKKFDAPVKRAGGTAGNVDKLSAQWIWSYDQKGKPAAVGETVSFRTSINLPTAPKSAAGAITCDNSFTLWINRKKVADGENWEAPENIDLLPHLVAGQNEIVIVGKNAGSAPNLAGLFFEAWITKADGTKQIVKTDASWTWNSAVPKANGIIPGNAADWKPVAIVDDGAWAGRSNDLLKQTLANATGDRGPMVRAALLKSDLLMRALGRPNREQIVSTRPNDLTTLEAMDLNNGQILTTRLGDGAAALLKQGGWASSGHYPATTDGLVTWLFAYAYSRTPSAEELALGREALGPKPTAEGLQDLLWVTLVQPEFQLIR